MGASGAGPKIGPLRLFIDWTWRLAPVLLFFLYEQQTSVLRAIQTRTEHGGRLAVLIPFIESEVSLIKANVAIWDRLFPCEAGDAVGRHVDLVFYYNGDWARRPELLSTLALLGRESRAVRECFAQVRFLMANLPPRSEEDRHPLGSSLMFFKAMELPALVDHYRYMYWMEADQRPCQRGWLSKLYGLAISNPGFWMIGSILRDGQNASTYYSFADHINGNALYRLDHDDFHQFLSQVQEEFSKNKGRFLAAFDIAIYLVARHSLSFKDYAAIKHRFIYTDVLQNVYRTQTNLTLLCGNHPNTYLVHGKYLTE